MKKNNKTPNERILVVDDDPLVLEMICEGLIDYGFEVLAAGNAKQALEFINMVSIHLALLDLDLGDNELDGVDLGNNLRATEHDPIVIIMTGYHNLSRAVEAMRQYAFHYMIKPFRIDQIISLFERAQREQALLRENRSLKTEIDELKKENEELRQILDEESIPDKENRLSTVKKVNTAHVSDQSALNSYKRHTK